MKKAIAYRLKHHRGFGTFEHRGRVVMAPYTTFGAGTLVAVVDTSKDRRLVMATTVNGAALHAWIDSYQLEAVYAIDHCTRNAMAAALV